ncbi:GNAT family N-acetyltransferase [Alteromonadaceae bacterium M269]|nr:GNAT family N-acetyltransferase [Alteromonadaceae bacterium M269]
MRRYRSGEEVELRRLFFETVRHINISDYSEEQVVAWAPEQYDEAEWCERIHSINPFVALVDEHIAGYASIDVEGYIDHFYCHRQFQGKGIGKSLMSRLFEQAEEYGVSRLYSHVSLTAKPFFEKHGFVAVVEQQVEVRGQKLTNFVMEKFADFRQ